MFNTFASQRLVFEEENEPFLIKIALNLTHEFLYDNFNNKIFMLKLSYKNSCAKFNAYSRQKDSFIFTLKEGYQKQKFYFIEMAKFLKF